MGSPGGHVGCDNGAIPSHALPANGRSVGVAGSTGPGFVVLPDESQQNRGDYRSMSGSTLRAPGRARERVDEDVEARVRGREKNAPALQRRWWYVARLVLVAAAYYGSAKGGGKRP